MRSRELAPIFSMPSAMLFISSMLAEDIFAFIVITFSASLLLLHRQQLASGFYRFKRYFAVKK